MCEKILAFLVFRNQVCKIFKNRKDNDGVQLLSHTEVTVIGGFLSFNFISFEAHILLFLNQSNK